MTKKLERDFVAPAISPADDRNLVSRTDVRREHRRRESELLALADKLAKMKPAQLRTLELAETPLEVIDELRVIESAPARNRALKRLRAGLRDVDLEALGRRLHALTCPNPDRPPDEVTTWHARLVAGGDAVLNAFLDRFPDADRARLRTLVRQAIRAKPTDQARASRKLKQALRAAMPREPNATE